MTDSFKPTAAQFAKSGEWETAWRFDHSSVPGESEIKKYLSGTTEAAFEIFFGEAFFGIRCDAGPAAVESFAINCVAAFSAAVTGDSFFKILSESLKTPFGQKLGCAELGAVNAWKSVGAVWMSADQLKMGLTDSLWAQIQASPLTADRGHPKALELIFTAPLTHWFGLPVSKNFPPYEMTRELLASVMQFSQISASLISKA